MLHMRRSSETLIADSIDNILSCPLYRKYLKPQFVSDKTKQLFPNGHLLGGINPWWEINFFWGGDNLCICANFFISIGKFMFTNSEVQERKGIVETH